MKYIDKFLKMLKTDRNTFATYVLTLISIYIVIDRLIEILFIGFSGISVSYWGPIKYTLALACPIFAFYFSFASKFVTHSRIKISFLYLYTIFLYIVGISMAIQWANHIGWLLLFSVPNYSYIISNFMDLIKPAFSALAWYLPITTFYPIFKYLYMKVNDVKDVTDSIMDYQGIDLSNKTEGTGPYTCEIAFCKDNATSKIIKIPECRRYEATLVVGNSGSGKTTMIFEPMLAKDMEKKFFLKEASKEIGFTALRTGLANLNCPYTNDFINKNFTLNMLTPIASKEKIFKTYVSKLTFSYAGENSVYKNLGLTYIALDGELLEHMKGVANNFGFNYYVVDTNDPNSIGLNPFAFKDPYKVSMTISSIFKRMFINSPITREQIFSAFNPNFIIEAIENLTLLLAEVYPTLNNGKLPTFETLIEFTNNFDLVEQYAEQMKQMPDLAQQYRIQLAYFEKNFYKTSSNREHTAEQLKNIAVALNNFLRYPGVRNILCNQNNNLNYDTVLKNGDIVFICTRRGDLGDNLHKNFGLFILLLMQNAIISRPGIEKTRIPHFLYIDEFSPFASKATEEMFTLYRKYKVGVIVSAQNLSQFENKSIRDTILANSTTKITFGNNTPEDNELWSKEFGDHREWKFTNNYDTAKGEYNQSYNQIKWDWKENIKPGEVQALAFKNIVYKTKDLKGKMIN